MTYPSPRGAVRSVGRLIRAGRVHPADVLVVAQGVAIAGLAWPGRGRWRLPALVGKAAALGFVAGSGLAATGLRTLGPDVTPFVDPVREATLRTRGPYRYSRNPVYAGVLVASWGLAVLRRRPEPLVAAAALSGVLHLKVRVEERHLRARFGEQYAAYAARTPRLLGPPHA